MALNLNNILESIIQESISPSNVSTDEIVNAIKTKRNIIIDYDDERPDPPRGDRLIEPCALGYTRANNLALRAFEYQGKTRRGVPKWKLFRIDRIHQWKPLKTHFVLKRPLYNDETDKSLHNIFCIAQFNDAEMIRRNIEMTQKEKEKSGFDVFGRKLKKPKGVTPPKGNKKGPVTNDDIKKRQMDQMWIDQEKQTQAQKDAEMDKMWRDMGNTTDYSTFNKDMRKGWDATRHRQKRAEDKKKSEEEKLKNLNVNPSEDYTDTPEYEDYKVKNGFLQEALNKIMKEIGYI